jgi:hypothetical protein
MRLRAMLTLNSYRHAVTICSMLIAHNMRRGSKHRLLPLLLLLPSTANTDNVHCFVSYVCCYTLLHT